MRGLILLVVFAFASSAEARVLRKTTCAEWRWEMTPRERLAMAREAFEDATAWWKEKTGETIKYTQGDLRGLCEAIEGYCKAGGGEPAGVFALRLILALFDSRR